MEQPTEAQVKEFWERCGGIFYDEIKGLRKQVVFGGTYYPQYKFFDLSNIELLGYLFKYAVDWDKVDTVQFSRGSEGCHCWLYMKKPVGKPFHGDGVTEALALFWALWQVKEGS